MAGLAEETIAADEAATIAEFIAFPAGVQRAATRARRARRSAASTRPAPRAAWRRSSWCRPTCRRRSRWGSSPQPATLSGAGAVCERHLDLGPRARHPRHVDQGARASPGDNLTPGAGEQDFVLNSHPVMMAADAKTFLELLQANEAGGLRRILYFISHPKAAAHRPRRPAAAHLPPGHPVLERNAVSVRRRARREVPHAAGAAASARRRPPPAPRRI